MLQIIGALKVQDSLSDNSKTYVASVPCVSEVRMNWVASTMDMISLFIDRPGENTWPDNEGWLLITSKKLIIGINRTL